MAIMLSVVLDSDVIFPMPLRDTLLRASEDLKNPPVSVTELLVKLSEQVPEFVSRIREIF